MLSTQSSRANRAGGALLFAFVLCGGAMLPSLGHAAVALAVALPPDVAKGGFSYGYSNGNDNADTADAKALSACRTTKDAQKDSRLRNLCKIILDYSDKCIAVTMDPAPGTPGVGWAIADDKRTAERSALKKCEDTAGPGRAAACVVDHSGCDGADR